MPPYNGGAEESCYSVSGANGTIAPQPDEAHYDDRSDAGDNIEKGLLKFPCRLYGREKELRTLAEIYADLVAGVEGKGCIADAERGVDGLEEDNGRGGVSCRTVFLSGYSGIGKSALIDEFVMQVRGEYSTKDDDDSSSPILCACGKYTEREAASAPFSAISEVLERLALDLAGGKQTTQVGWQTNVRTKIRECDLIGTGTEGNRILRATFTVLAPLLDDAEGSSQSQAVHPSMNAIKESTKALLSTSRATRDKSHE